jgi:hypothetical protein
MNYSTNGTTFPLVPSLIYDTKEQQEILGDIFQQQQAKG